MKFLINHIKQQYHIKDYKFGLIISVVAISVIGIMMVGSAKPDFMTKQIIRQTGRKDGSTSGLCSFSLPT